MFFGLCQNQSADGLTAHDARSIRKSVIIWILYISLRAKFFPLKYAKSWTQKGVFFEEFMDLLKLE